MEQINVVFSKSAFEKTFRFYENNMTRNQTTADKMKLVTFYPRQDDPNRVAMGQFVVENGKTLTSIRDGISQQAVNQPLAVISAKDAYKYFSGNAQDALEYLTMIHTQADLADFVDLKPNALQVQ